MYLPNEVKPDNNINGNEDNPYDRIQHRINRRSFLQISRHAVMNIDHLESLSDSFSGNMMAKMTGGVKSSVSRKYVKSLMDYLGV